MIPTWAIVVAASWIWLSIGFVIGVFWQVRCIVRRDEEQLAEYMQRVYADGVAKGLKQGRRENAVAANALDAMLADVRRDRVPA